jgi:hypothetical protein
MPTCHARVGRALLDQLMAAARAAGYTRIRLDSTDLVTAAHGLHYTRGLLEIGR